MLIIGLTGDVGAGKSTLCKAWAAQGALIIDSDQIAKNMWALPAVQKKAKKRWGEDFFDEDIKKVYAKIADKIFASDEEYEFVSKLLYAPTTKEIQKQLKRAKKHSWAVVEMPLLFERGAQNLFDIVVYAAATLKKREERNCARNWTKTELKRRQAKFLPRKDKMAACDLVLQNAGTQDAWCEKAEKAGKKFIKLAAARKESL